MSIKDWILTLLIVVIWGINFTVTKIGINNLPPMLLASIRFVFVAFPAVFFVKPPKISWIYTVGYALTIGVGQFACLYYAIYIGMPAGLTSVVLQSSSFITILLATLLLKERLKGHQVTGLIIAVSGLTLIGLTAGRTGGTGIPLAAILLTVVAAVFWSISTMIVKKAAQQSEASGEKLNVFGLVAWSALVVPVPMLLLSLTMHPPQVIWLAFLHIDRLAIASVLYLSWCSTLFGAGVWNYLLSKYDAGRVAPLSLLVPAVGLVVARIVLSEALTGLQWAGSLVIIAGLVVFNLGFRPFKSIGSNGS